MSWFSLIKFGFTLGVFLALVYILRMYPQKAIREEKKEGNFYYTYTLSDGKNKLVLTDKVKSETKEVEVLYVYVEGIKEKAKEIRFIK